LENIEGIGLVPNNALQPDAIPPLRVGVARLSFVR